MQNPLIHHFPGADTIYHETSRPNIAAKDFPDVVLGRTKAASQIGYEASQHSGPRKHPEGKGSILEYLAIKL